MLLPGMRVNPGRDRQFDDGRAKADPQRFRPFTDNPVIGGQRITHAPLLNRPEQRFPSVRPTMMRDSAYSECAGTWVTLHMMAVVQLRNPTEGKR